MPSSLYLTLLNGRTIHVTDTWDGLEPTRIGTVDASGAPDDGKGIEAGEYYRDIHRHEFEFSNIDSPNGAGQHGGSGSLPGVGVVPATLTPTRMPSYGGLINSQPAAPAMVMGELTIGASDLLTHEKPRTWQKVCTWLVFTGTDGKFHWRACNVDGWSSQAPID